MNDRQAASQADASYELPEATDFSWDEAYQQVRLATLQNQPVILYGPPGTGKTKLIYELKKDLASGGQLGNFEVIQFHRKFSYEDFIEGFTPTEHGFDKRDGVLKAFIKNHSEAAVDLFLIDEINRAEITTTFGELMFLIEDRSERSVKTSHFSEDLSLPQNLSLIGTMNTADRNIAALDFALRRRFQFIPIFPDYAVLTSWLNQRGLAFDECSIDDYVHMVRTINQRISSNRLMGRNMQLGHAMWVPKGNGQISQTQLCNLLQFEIIPQLEAYLGFGNENQLAEMLNSNIANLYLQQKSIDFAAAIGLIRDLANARA